MANSDNKSGVLEKSVEEIAAHNAAIDAQISEKTNTINSYNLIKENSQTIISELNSLVESSSQIGVMLENYSLSKKPVDEGCFKENQGDFTNYCQVFEQIISVCNIKIEELEAEIKSLESQKW